jgi:biotin operon repressor
MTDAPEEQVEKKYISIEKAGLDLGVSRTAVYYYIRQLKIKTEKFELDRKAYIAKADLDRIKAAKQAALEGQR